MAHFNSDLREMFRADLVKTVGDALRDDLPKAMQHAMIEMVDERVFDAVDHLLDRFLNQEEMDCWLSFGREGAQVLVGMGPGDCAAQFTPELSIETHENFPLTPTGEQDVLDQLAGIRAFMGKLREAEQLLQARAHGFTRVHSMTT